jgi:Uncharacterized protein conserved in archaea
MEEEGMSFDELDEVKKLQKDINMLKAIVSVLDRNVDMLMKSRARKERYNPFVREGITKQQKEILVLYKKGLSQTEIAKQLKKNQGNISRTIKRLVELGLLK